MAVGMWSASAQARVFVFGEETFASYLKADYVMTALKQKPFEYSSGSQTTSFEGTYGSSAPAYEFGFAWSAGRAITRVGLSIIKPNTVEFEAFNSGGQKLFTGSSEIYGYAGKIGFEVNFKPKKWTKARFFVMADGGAATLTVANGYSNITTPGYNTYPNMRTFREEIKGTAATFSGAVGFETIAFDTTTFILELGYRSMNFTSFDHNRDAYDFSGQTVSKGAAAVDSAGDARTLNLGGPYAALMLRFWLF